MKTITNLNTNIMVLIANDIRSAWNVGSFFRTADGIGISKIYLTGYTATPENDRVIKTSLGAEKFIPWEKYRNGWRLVDKLKKEGFYIVALEQTKNSIDITKFKPKFPLALIVGNEIRGVTKGLLDRADKKVAIPQYGHKESLNVAVAFGIAVWQITKN